MYLGCVIAATMGWPRDRLLGAHYGCAPRMSGRPSVPDALNLPRPGPPHRCVAFLHPGAHVDADMAHSSSFAAGAPAFVRAQLDTRNLSLVSPVCK